MNTTVNPVEANPFAIAQAAEAQADAVAQAALDEEAAVKAWFKKLEEARDFDKNARKQYAIDRTYAGGTAGKGNFDVRVNIAGTYVDILTAFLYARNPEIDVATAAACGPSRIEVARQLSKTLEIVNATLWKKGRLKLAARPMVRSGLSVGIGWIKAAWHERTGSDPLVATKISDLQDNLRRLQVSQDELASGEADDPAALRASIESQIEGLQANVEVVLSRGLVMDYVAPEDIQVSPDVARLENYLDAPWIAHRTFMSQADAEVMFPKLRDKLKHASVFQQVKPADLTAPSDSGVLANTSAEDADSYRGGTSLSGGSCGPAHLCVWEIQCKDENIVYTVIEGLKCWARPPYAPKPASSRFYTLFQWAPIQVDGRRHPESLVTRSVELLDEYSRTRTNFREHRRRAIPKMGFNRRAVSKEEAKRMEAGAIGEMVGLDVNDEGGDVLFPIQYNQIDMALYDTAVIRAELEMIWGIQEALSSTIRTAKTLGEAEIQQSGTEARQSFKRDSLEELLTDLALFTSEVGLQELSDTDVRILAGPEAFWPSTETEKLTVEDLDTLVSVQIRAGSSGKPNTTARREQWTAVMPVLREAIQYIAQLRQSSPLDVAKCIEQLVIETLERTGENIDSARFLPPLGQPVQLMDPATGQPVMAFPAQQSGAGPQPPGENEDPNDPAALAA